MVEHYLALSQLLYDDVEHVPSALTPTLRVSSEVQQSIEQQLTTSHINIDSLVIFCPGAEYGPTKRWPSNHFAMLAQSLIDENINTQVILLGSRSDQKIAADILSQVNKKSHLHNWCGNTSLDEAIALIGMAKIVISNDSGLMHIAAALKTPQVAIFGSSDPAHTPPLSDKAKIVWLNLPCSPCHKKACPLGHLKCLNDILPQEVLATLNTLQ
jgi:heptosyltransferase-2